MSRDRRISEKFVLFVEMLPLLLIVKSMILFLFFPVLPAGHIAAKHNKNAFLNNLLSELSSTASIVYTYLHNSHEGGLSCFYTIIHDLSQSSCINSTLPAQ